MDASNRAAESHGLGLWWTILILGCIVSVVLNIWHAMTLNTGAKGHPVLGIIFALVPVLFAALLSHGLVSPVVAKWFKWPILALFGMAMVTSISSQAAVLQPYGGGYGGEWSIPIVLDAATLLALNAITSTTAAARKAAAVADMEADMERLRADMRPDIEADVHAELQADMPRIRADIEASVRRTLEADIAAREADMRADIHAQAEADMASRLESAALEIRRQAEVETEARIRRELAETRKTQSSGKTATAPARKAADDGLTTKDKARILLASNPDMTGAELGRTLGVAERSGRRLLDELTVERDESGGHGGGHEPAVGGHSVSDGVSVSAGPSRLRAVM
jgi:hypothetical protein